MLLVHDNQSQLGECNLILKQRVRADGQLCFALRDTFDSGLFIFFLQAARKPYGADAKRLQPIPQFVIVLFGKYFGGRHQCHLIAIFYRLQGGQ